MLKFCINISILNKRFCLSYCFNSWRTLPYGWNRSAVKKILQANPKPYPLPLQRQFTPQFFNFV
ncbi:hypothetical protein BDI4_1080005 [Burkholderia diffusa]|nr:hypothetical protein BDI4_1080005 [Burkholderia diffusa]